MLKPTVEGIVGRCSARTNKSYKNNCRKGYCWLGLITLVLVQYSALVSIFMNAIQILKQTPKKWLGWLGISLLLLTLDTYNTNTIQIELKNYLGT